MDRYGAYMTLWPLKPCDPVRDWDGDLFCKTHSSGPYYNNRQGYTFGATQKLGLTELPPEGALCVKAIEITQIAKAVIQEIEERERAARRFWASGDENGRCL